MCSISEAIFCVFVGQYRRIMSQSRCESVAARSAKCAAATSLTYPPTISHTPARAVSLSSFLVCLLSEISEVHDPSPQPGDPVCPPAEASRAHTSSRRWTLLYLHGQGCTCCLATSGKVAGSSSFCRFGARLFSCGVPSCRGPHVRW